MLSVYQLDKFKSCFPHGQIKVLENSNIEILRHPKAAKTEIYKHWKNVASLIATSTRSWKVHNQNILSHGSEIMIQRENYYGRDTKIELHCLLSCCGHSWLDTYANVYNQISKWERKRNITDEQRKHIACPQCRKLIYKTNTQAYQFKNMSNDELLIAARNVFPKNLESNGIFRKKHSVLSNEMNIRKVNGKSLLELFSEEQGWRVVRPELMNYSYNDWHDYLELRDYKTLNEWRKDDPRAQYICSSLNKNTYYIDLKNEFFNKERLTLDGIQYDSTSELLVAKVLSHLNISFIAHGKWGFYYKKRDNEYKTRNRRHPEYDFKFCIKDKIYIVEVWLCSRDNLKFNEMKDKMLLDYLNKRSFKTENALIHHPEVTLVSIEARINRKNGQKAFLEHVQKVFHNQIGMSEVNNIDFESLYEGDPRPLSQWKVCDFFRECRETSAKKITDLSISLQNCLRRNKDIQVSLAQLLARKHGYPLNTIFYLAPLSHVVKYCSKRPELSNRKVYQELHSDGKLPHGFPQRVVNAYDSIMYHSQICGIEHQAFINYYEAKKLVQKYKFRNSVIFEIARDSSEDKFTPLKQIYKIPDHPISGYPEWEDWATFLGNKKPWHLSIEGQEAIKILKEGSVKEVASYITRALGCHKRSEFRKISCTAMKALRLNRNAQDIEIIAFGSTTNLKFDLETVVKTVKHEDLLTEKIWQEKRAKHKTYQRILSRFYLKWPEYKGEWKNVLKVLETFHK
ncbi:hypothetical protein [Psychromonas aquatilis]|uniref:TniQ protein n=1 Tax=Psychromonas aquatilis TaxID=2005072 RepID=A0ABU9GTZ7_9GAMM